MAPATVAMIQSKDVADVAPGFAKINNQFIGILCGIIAGELYNKFAEVKLPELLLVLVL